MIIIAELTKWNVIDDDDYSSTYKGFECPNCHKLNLIEKDNRLAYSSDY